MERNSEERRNLCTSPPIIAGTDIAEEQEEQSIDTAIGPQRR